jgi:cell wall assembly regulator SMI1
MGVGESWARIEARLGENAPAIRKSLRPGVKDGATEKLQTRLGVMLPADFTDSLHIHDGQKADADDGLFPLADDVLGAMPSFRLLPVSEIRREWSMMKELCDLGEFKGRTSRPGRGIGREWWNTGWVPISDNGGGDYFCLDMAPGKGGTAGQVMMFFHDAAERPLLARSFAAWFEKLAKGFASGKYVLDKDDGIVAR